MQVSAHRRDRVYDMSGSLQESDRCVRQTGTDATAAQAVSSSGAPCGPEILSISGRSRAVVPDRRHRVFVIGVDNRRACGDVVVIAYMPLRHVEEMEISPAA